jgi:hypothetical protein
MVSFMPGHFTPRERTPIQLQILRTRWQYYADQQECIFMAQRPFSPLELTNSVYVFVEE